MYTNFTYTSSRRLASRARLRRLCNLTYEGDVSSEDKSHVGDVYKNESGRPPKIDQYEVDYAFTRDQWGEWLSANAPLKEPLKDTSGNVVAGLGVDVASAAVLTKMRNVLLWALMVVGIAGGLAVGVASVLSNVVTKPLYALREATEAIGRGDLDARVNVATNDEFGQVARSLNTMAAALREGETVKSFFARYVSSEVMDTILAPGKAATVKGTRRRITVLFSDIRGFTAMSENMRPEEVVSLLNQYFDKMVDVVFRNHATLSKFIGDGLMVIFGAPGDDPYQEEHAVQAALEMRDELCKLCEERGRSIRIGIGINSGAAVVGNLGSSRRIEYTAIGDTVNLAARLEGATKDVGADILISEYTYAAIRGIFKTTQVGAIQVKGRSDPVVVYSVEGSVDGPARVG